MPINLNKGQTIDLRKNDKGESEYDLSSVTIGLGWDVRQKETSFFSKLLGGTKEQEYDLDAIAFLLDENGKVADQGRTVEIQGRTINRYEGDIIYYNSLKHPSGHIWLTGDNRTGEGEGDDEQIIVNLDLLDKKYKKILFVVSIYRGRRNNQHFSMVENAFIRAVDAKGKEITRFSLSGDDSLNGICSIVFSEVYRHNNEWKFKAIGAPYQTDSFVDILKEYT